MEYCLTILVQHFEPNDRFMPQQTIPTPWGEAVRSERVGRHFWTPTLFVERIPFNAYMLRYLPQRLRVRHWTAFSVGGNDISNFQYVEFLSGEERAAFDPYKTALVSLVKVLLAEEHEWAVYFMKHCDQIAHRYEQTLRDLVDCFASAYDATSDAAQGFCSYSKN